MRGLLFLLYVLFRIRKAGCIRRGMSRQTLIMVLFARRYDVISSPVPTMNDKPAAADVVVAFAMPTDQGHREQHSDNKLEPTLHFNARVIWPALKSEIARALVAREAMQQERGRLRTSSVSGEDNPREWGKVRVEAQNGG